MAGRLLNLCKTIDKRLWGFENPLRQFPLLTNEILNKLEAKKMTVDRLKEMDPKEIGQGSAYWILWNHWDLWGSISLCFIDTPTIYEILSLFIILRS